MPRPTLPLALGLVLVALAGPARAQPAPAVHVAVHEAKAVTRGKPFGSYPSADGSATVVYGPGTEGGDFPQSPVLLRAGAHTYDLGSYRSVESVSWKGQVVTIEASRLLSYGIDEVCRVVYRVGDKQLSRQPLKQVKDEASG